MRKKLVIRGAREHNLKNINVDIPRNQLTVFTGVSGSGKSSLAFDTIYAEGQRRYIESLSAYARQFLGRMEKPDVDYIEGLSPAVSIEQKKAGGNPRSTVGTVTEIYDYLRLLYARVGIPHCPECGKRISKQTPQQIVDRLLAMNNKRIWILAPVVSGRKGEYKKLFADLKRQGYARVRVDGTVYTLDQDIKLEKYKIHNIDVVVDRLIIKPKIRKRLTDSVETALTLGKGLLIAYLADETKNITFSEHLACTECGINLPEMQPRMFSFNSPYGACTECDGLGSKLEFDPDLIIVNPELSILEGAFMGKVPSKNSWSYKRYRILADHYSFSLSTPIKELSEKIINILLYGSGKEKIRFQIKGKEWSWDSYRPTQGIIPVLKRRFRSTDSEIARNYYMQFMSKKPCSLCNGKRLRPESLAVTFGGKNITELASLPVTQLKQTLDKIKLSKKVVIIAKEILKEIKARLGFLEGVGLSYLSIDRPTHTLSGGEAQRIHLATQIGSSLVGVLYVLDEPSIGLHQRDKQRLISTLSALRDLGNTIIVVEHDEDTIRSADYIVDLGPGAGAKGGYVVATGSPAQITKNKKSLTGQYLSGKLQIKMPTRRRKNNGEYIIIKGASQNNLKNLNIKIPLGVFTCVTGVSGSGKSSLIEEVLYKGVARKLHRARATPGKHVEILGLTNIDKVIAIDQSPIGRTPRSNPATYTKVFDHIRDIYAQTPESRARGYQKGRFSFNLKGGRCEACKGAGETTIEMHFLPDVSIPCEVCKNRRYNRDTLEILYKGKNISDILQMSVDEALEFFKNIPSISRILQTIHDVGLGYIKLGQPAPTLSGGEAQRVKLARELSKKTTGKTLYILDEPTTGLHYADIEYLLEVLGRLTDKGNTVVVIEHNMDVIKTADHIIDLGPEGGDEGGDLVVEGSPEMVMNDTSSHTGKFLKDYLTKTNQIPNTSNIPQRAKIGLSR